MWGSLRNLDEDLTEALFYAVPRWRLPYELFTFFADGVFWFPLVISGLMLQKSPLQADTMSLLWCGLVTDLFIVCCIKMVFRRDRPKLVDQDFRFVGPDKHSFPSGHTSRATFLSFFGTLHMLPELQGLLPEVVVPYAPQLLFIWAEMIGMSRIALGRHHVSDVLFGKFVGILVYFIVVSQSAAAYREGIKDSETWIRNVFLSAEDWWAS
eukprot:Rmarinus@m.5097